MPVCAIAANCAQPEHVTPHLLVKFVTLLVCVQARLHTFVSKASRCARPRRNAAATSPTFPPKASTAWKLLDMPQSGHFK